MRYALKEINENPDVLLNITLGFQAYDSCDDLKTDLEGTLQIVTGYDRAIPNYRCLGHVPLSSIIGPAKSTHSILLAHILGVYNYPQISHFSTSALLSDRTQFPSFFRTVPSDTFQSKGLAHLVLHLGWTWIGLLAVDNDYGRQGIQLVRQEIIKAGACVAFSENILTNHPDHNAPHIVKVMKASTAKVIVIYAADIELLPILDEMLRQNVTQKTLVASEAWSTSTLRSLGKFSTLLSGTIGLTLHSGTIPGLREFLNKIHPSISSGRDWVKIFWELAFSCRFATGTNQTGDLASSVKECTGSEVLDDTENSFNDVSSLRATYSVYTAVQVVAQALENLKNCKDGEGPFHKGSCASIWNFKPWQLLYYIKKARVALSSGRQIYFDRNGDPPAVYDIVNWQLNPSGGIRYVKVGRYDMASTQIFTINTSAVVWNSGDRQVPVSVCSQSCPPGFWKAAKRGEPVCCFQCLPCPHGEISNSTDSTECIKCPWDTWPNPEKSICLQKPVEYLSYEDPLGRTLSSTSIVSSLVPFFVLKLFIQFRTTPIVKANNYSLSCLLLVSLSFCFLCSLSFIGYPQPETCLLRQVAFGVVFTICISCILAKTILVVLAFMATKPGSALQKWTSPLVSYMIISICSLLQFILCIVWLSIAPPFPVQDPQPRVIILDCNQGSPTAFWSMLGYLGLLASISFIVAFLARGLPDSFNEAKFITFSMLAFLSVWVSFIPASLSAQGRYIVAMEIFAILASSWALLACMFAPKCFIILCRRSTNSRDNLIKKFQNSSE
ncbi:extracellular calcium-sensing receptor-like [Spea bombifrons]|uniref:extracellular calcium-sensing receptor-like n=1 Tax=Spea bombifrons TaxID=233779 RepID=UPI002349180F|nr:extracellular calcium-sensing receptor-like [Spea bombifrons]